MLSVIYRLVDPQTEETRYIGQTDRTLQERLREHVKSRRRCHLTNWIQSLKNDGLSPSIQEIVRVPQSQADEMERLLITFFRSVGFRLTNHDGGGKHGRVVSPETRARMSAATSGSKNPMYGRPVSDERRKALAAAFTGDKNPMKNPEIVEKVASQRRGKSIPHKGVPCSPEKRKKISESNKGKPGTFTGRTHSLETKLKISQAKKGKPGVHSMLGKTLSEEAKAKISAAHKGKPLSLEHRAKIAESNRTYWQSYWQKRRAEIVSQEPPEPLRSDSPPTQ